MHRRRKPRPIAEAVRLFALGCAASLLGGSPDAQAGGIEVFAAETLFNQGTRLSLSHVYERKSTLQRGTDEVPNPLGLGYSEHRIVAGIDHGVRPDLTLSALVPFVTKELESSAGDLRSAGLGDVALLAKYRAYRAHWPRGAAHVAVIGGLEVPTGETDESDGGMRLPTPLQPGLGSWNPFAALSGTVDADRFRFDALAFFKLNTQGAQDFEKGDFFALGADAAYRFLHTKYPGPTAGVRLGLQWRSQGRASQNRAPLGDSGSEELLLRTGLGWHPSPGIDISLEVGIPVFQDVGGQQLALDYRTILAAGFRF